MVCVDNMYNIRLAGFLALNLFHRVAHDLADCGVVIKRGFLYKMCRLRERYDDVGPDEGDEHFVVLPEDLTELATSLEKYPWFQQFDRKAAQDFVLRGGDGCFVVRPSGTTRSLTLTLCYGNKSYNILIRRREDGLLALGSKKHNEISFRTVEEMVQHYQKEELILYSSGELIGRSKLRPAKIQTM